MKNVLCLLVFLSVILPSCLFAQTPDSLARPADTLHTQPADMAPVPKPVYTPPPSTPAPAPAQPAAAAPAPTPKQGRSFSEKFAFGLGTGFWITPSTTYVEVAPMLAYRFPKRLITGAGYRYIYRHDRVIDRDLNSYGPNFFARLDLLKRVYLWSEYEILTSEYISDREPEKGRQDDTVDSWFAGLGYVRTLGKKGRGGISMQLLYNILWKDDGINPYYSPLTYRVGYFF